jgi:hypothetical protein
MLWNRDELTPSPPHERAELLSHAMHQPSGVQFG